MILPPESAEYLLRFTVYKTSATYGMGGHGHGWVDEAEYDIYGKQMPPRRQAIKGLTRELTLIMFGTFGLQDISMPAVVEDASQDRLLIANPSHLLRGSPGAILNNEGIPQNIDIFTIQKFMFCTSGLMPNHNDDHEMCPLDFQLFKFVLKTHFGRI